MTLELHDFASASRSVLAYLHGKLGFQLWMVTRTRGDDWLVLQSEDHGYDVEPGHMFKWADSFCSEMVQGHGPRIAPDAQLVPAYASARIAEQVPIGAYIGVPITAANGEFFGTLCGIDPERQPEGIVADQALVELLAALLSSILAAELSAAEAARHNERLALDALVDPLTQLSNRRAWDELLAREDERCQRYGHAAAAFFIDLDDLKQHNDSGGHAAGDALLVQAAQALREVTRDVDILARLGGDEFGVVAVECDCVGARLLLQRMREAFASRQVDVSIGLAMRDAQTSLAAAWQQADAHMYAEKRSKKLRADPGA